MIGGYNDTLKAALTSSPFYEGLYGITNRKFLRPDHGCDLYGKNRKNSFNTNEDCDRYGMYTGATDIADLGKRFYAQGAYEIVDRTDLDQERARKAYPHDTLYPYQIHFPDASGSYSGYDSCNVWKTPEVIKKSRGASLEPQYMDFFAGSSAPNWKRNEDDYESPQLSFYNALNARVMNFTSVGQDNVKDIFAFKYELDDDMWLNDGTFDADNSNPDNAKYRHTGPNYLMELTSQHGVPVYLSKPYLEDYAGTDHIAEGKNGDFSDDEDYSSAMWIEPLTGKAIKGKVNLQVNNGILNKMLNVNTLYTKAMENGYSPSQWSSSGFSATIVPFFWVQAEGEISDDAAADVVKMMKDVDDGLAAIPGILSGLALIWIFGIIILVLGCCCCGGGAVAGSGGKTAPAK